MKPTGRAYARGDGGGLELAVTPKGTKVWRWRYRFAGAPQSVTLGRWPRMSLDHARKRREGLRRRVDAGENPAAGGRLLKARRTRVEEFGARWVAEVVRKARKNTAPVERLLEREVYPRLGRQAIAGVTSEDVQALVFAKRDAGRPAAAAAIRNTLKRMFDYARVCHIVTPNPAEATPLKFLGQRRSRSRTLSAAELRAFLGILRQAQTGSSRLGLRMALALELILLTLARKSELRLARWEHIDLDKRVWEIPAELSKTGVPHIVYLSGRAVEILEQLRRLAGRAEVVLPARESLTQPVTASALNKAVARVKWGMPGWTPHDLRRTGATILNELGYNADVIEKALNHAARGIRAVYNRAQYAEQRRQMLEEWATWLERL